jgi:hypothetical protein
MASLKSGNHHLANSRDSAGRFTAKNSGLKHISFIEKEFHYDSKINYPHERPVLPYGDGSPPWKAV